MTATLTVVAAGTDPVPMEQLVGWIKAEPVQVPDTHYYRRLLADDSIRLAPPASAIQSTPKQVKNHTSDSAASGSQNEPKESP